MFRIAPDGHRSEPVASRRERCSRTARVAGSLGSRGDCAQRVGCTRALRDAGRSHRRRLLPLGPAGRTRHAQCRVHLEPRRPDCRSGGRPASRARLSGHHRIEEPGGLGSAIPDRSRSHSARRRTLLGRVSDNAEGVHLLRTRPRSLALALRRADVDSPSRSRRRRRWRARRAPWRRAAHLTLAERDGRGALSGASRRARSGAGRHGLRPVLHLLQFFSDGIGSHARGALLQAGRGAAPAPGRDPPCHGLLDGDRPPTPRRRGNHPRCRRWRTRNRRRRSVRAAHRSRSRDVVGRRGRDDDAGAAREGGVAGAGCGRWHRGRDALRLRLAARGRTLVATGALDRTVARRVSRARPA